MTNRLLKPSHITPVLLLAIAVAASAAPPTPTRLDSVSAWRERLLRAADEAEHQLSALLGDAFGTADATPSRPNGLFLVAPDGAESRISTKTGETPHATPRVVLVVHGLDEPGNIWDQLIPAIQHAGHNVARFDYPNDQPAALSADLLADALTDLRAAGCEHVDLVCHSMGGLIALDVLSRPAFHDARAAWPHIDRYITLGTPFGGSPFARLRALAEVRDRVERWIDSDRRDLNALLDWSSDGNGEAGDDLMPGSPYLVALADRELPAGIASTAIIARMADIAPPDLSELTESWILRRVAGDAEIEAIAAAIRRASLEVGDGVVPESSARARPIEDTAVVRSNHRDMIATVRPIESIRRAIHPDAPERVPPAIPIVLERLASPVPAATSPDH